jgi:Secretion system C-terminal sorting domain
MKKFLLVLSLFISFAALQKANAQCNVGGETIIIKSLGGTPGNCTVTFDLIFDLENNAGNKYVFIHAYTAANYPYAGVGYFATKKPGTCAPGANQSTVAPPTRTNGGDLNLALINVGFNNDFGTGGYLSYVTGAGYSPDPGAPMTIGTGLVEKTASPIAGFDRYTMRNLTINTGLPCGAPLTVKADLWSSQASSLSVAHCWRCEFSFSFNDPIISGLVNCSNPRTFNLTLQTTSSSALGGTYDIYYDNAPFNSFGPEDILGGPVKTGTFTGLTSSSPVAKINETYTGNTDPAKSTLSLWADIKVTSGTVQSNTVAKLLNNNCFTLPVNLKNFDAAKRTGKVAVTWQTEQEVNNDGFEIQRRVGNGKYETIAFVDSKAPGGNSNGAALSYSYDDNTNLPNGVAYYRLRQVDLDGKSIYSEIKAVRSNSKSLYITVYPNPSRGTTNVAIPEGVGTVDVALEDFSGKLVQRWNALNVRNLQLTNLKAGIYMIRINARETGEQVVERIVVQ